MITSAKNYRKKKWTDITLGQIVKAKLYRQNHTQKQGGGGRGRCEIGEESQKVQISSYKINALWDVMYRMLKIKKNKMKSYDVNSSLA